jgi:glycosyltransferase involved in cell wall biosynthesis
VFLLFGALAPRKGINTVLEAMKFLTSETLQSITIVFAGRLEASSRDCFIKNFQDVKSSFPSLALHLEDRYLDNDEISGLVLGADVILAPYLRHVGSSGVLYWAVSAKKPIISQDYGLLGQQIKNYDRGISVDTRNPELLSEAISNAVYAVQNKNEKMPDQPEKCIQQTPEKLAKAIIEGIAGPRGI